jgi:hypothetical protein
MCLSAKDTKNTRENSNIGKEHNKKLELERDIRKELNWKETSGKNGTEQRIGIQRTELKRGIWKE